MHIIVNAISANTGGIVTYTTNLIDYLARAKVSATIYVPPGFNATANTDSTVKVVPVTKRFWGPVHRFFWEQISWRRVVKKSGADVLFSSANYGVLFPPIPQVLLVQGEIYLNPLYRENVLPKLSRPERLSAYLRRHLMLWSARRSRSTIFPSQVALDAAADYDKQLVETASVNYLGVNPRFEGHKKRRQWQADKTIRLLYVSVYYPHKDPVTLAEATYLLNQRGMNAEARITMEDEDFEAWDNAQKDLALLRNAKYSDCVRMGRIDHVSLRKALQEFDVFVFPSMAETFGFPMVEAMRAGVPLVVSDIPVHREICGDAALYFRLSDPEDLASKIEELNSKPSLRKQLMAKAQTRVAGQFTWESHVAKMFTIMSEIVEHPRHRILINALHARTGGGVTYLRNMLPLLSKDSRLSVHVCLHQDQSEVLPADLDNITYHYQRYRRGFWRILIREQIDLPRLAKRLAADTIFSPANYGPFRAKNHVVMARNAVSVGFVERRPIKLAYWALLYAATFISFIMCRRAIAVSEYAKRGMDRAFFGLFSKKLVVVPHGVEDIFQNTLPLMERDQFALAVSDIYVQKNFTTLVHALARVQKKIPDLKLKIAGHPIDDDYFSHLQHLIRSLKLEGSVEFLGHVQAPALKELYQMCRLFVFPSTIETFGNPLVEAMACGAPIASSNTAAMPEVLGKAAYFFNPNSVEDMAGAIIYLLEHKEVRGQLGKLAKERAKTYSWEHTKECTVDVILSREQPSS